MLLARRSFLTGLASALAAPAIVKAASLMPVKALKPDTWSLRDYGGGFEIDDLQMYGLLVRRIDEVGNIMRVNLERCLFADYAPESGLHLLLRDA